MRAASEMPTVWQRSPSSHDELQSPDHRPSRGHRAAGRQADGQGGQADGQGGQADGQGGQAGRQGGQAGQTGRAGRQAGHVGWTAERACGRRRGRVRRVLGGQGRTAATKASPTPATVIGPASAEAKAAPPAGTATGVP